MQEHTGAFLEMESDGLIHGWRKNKSITWFVRGVTINSNGKKQSLRIVNECVLGHVQLQVSEKDSSWNCPVGIIVGALHLVGRGQVWGYRWASSALKWWKRNGRKGWVINLRGYLQLWAQRRKVTFTSSLGKYLLSICARHRDYNGK